MQSRLNFIYQFETLACLSVIKSTLYLNLVIIISEISVEVRTRHFLLLSSVKALITYLDVFSQLVGVAFYF